MSLKSIFRKGSGGGRDVDMTQGSIVRHIVTFALPLVLGNLFQQLYNTVDTWVVGNFVSLRRFPPWARSARSSIC